MKIEKDTIDKITQLQNAETQILIDMGNLSVQYKTLSDQLNEKLTEAISERQKFYEKFEEQYGKGEINLETMEFIKKENEEVSK